MALEKIITYSDATVSSSDDLEKLENYTRIALKPRNELGNHITSLLHFDEVNADETQYRARYFKDSAYDEKTFCVGARWDGSVKKFGAAALKISDQYAGVRLPYNSRYNNLPNFTIDFFVRFIDVTGNKYLIHEYYYLSPSVRGRWYIQRTGTNITFAVFDSNGNISTRTSEGVTLQANTWYHIRVGYYSMTNGTSIGRISIDGQIRGISESMRLLPTLDKSICPRVAVGGIYNHGYPYFASAANAYFDELTIYNILLTATYTPPGSAMAPFATDNPTATLNLDSGFNYAAWDASSISFLDEADFANNGIKLRWDADNDDSPEFSGEPMTLSQFKNGNDPIGRYLHLEFTFYSDGNTKRILFPGKITLCSGKPSVIARRKPEIIRR